jgi:hypothetical protein
MVKGDLILLKFLYSGLISTREVKVMNNLCSVRGLLTITAVVAMALVLSPVTSRADQVVHDNQIVVGSQCVGLDCQLDEVFGLTTLLLKENNLRIFFQDTSTSALFPKNDWEILVNDSANGGESFLGFADRGEGVAGASGAGQCVGSVDDGQMCGLSGQATCEGTCSNDSNVTCIDNSFCEPFGLGVCENVGACVPFGAVIFRIGAGAPADSLVIDRHGRLGVGTGNPRRKLHVRGNAKIDGTLFGYVVNLFSSRDDKRDIQDLEQSAALDVLKTLRPVSYRLNARPDESTLGFIAEDVPELVATGSRKTVNPMKIIAVLTRALQSQQQLIENQEKKAMRLEARISELEQVLLSEEGGLE